MCRMMASIVVLTCLSFYSFLVSWFIGPVVHLHTDLRLRLESAQYYVSFTVIDFGHHRLHIWNSGTCDTFLPLAKP
jgi:hypothetical protein